jgi:predicted membrane protein
MENNNNSREHGRIIGGLILVGVGCALLLRNMDFPIPHWLFTWPMILILVGVYSGFKHNFRNSSWIILMGIGTFFLFDRYIFEVSLEPYFWPIFIIVIGVLFIIRPRRRNRWWQDPNGNFKNKWQDKWGNNFSNTSDVNYTADSSDFFKIHSVFSGVKRTILSKNFQGGSVSCVFGGAEIDLMQADFNGKVVIRIEAVFGGAKILIPANWVLQNEIDGVFHGVEDKRQFNPGIAANADKVLVLRGSAVFGGVEIKSY